MLHLEAEWPFKKYLNCRHNFVRTRTLAGFKVWGEQNTFLGGKDFSICHIFDRNFSEHSKILEVQKDLGAIVPESSPHLPYRPGQNRRQKILHLGASCVCRGARHSEYLFSIHNMNSICRFCKLIINILPQRHIIGSCFPTKIFCTSLMKGIGS